MALTAAIEKQLKQALADAKKGDSFEMYNPLDEVPEELREMDHLESINLPLIRSGVIPEWFWERPALKRLSMSVPDGGIPHEIECLQSLEDLTVVGKPSGKDEGFPLETLPSSLKNLCKLTALGLGSTQMREFPEVISELKPLKDLGIHRAGFGEIPDSILHLTGLRRLALSSVPLVELPEVLFRFGELVELSLQFTELSSLSDELSKLENLESLTISRAKLTSLGEGLVGLDGLERLFLTELPLKEFPSAIVRLSSLEVLTIRECGLEEIPIEVLDLPSLEDLDISLNPLSPECYAMFRRDPRANDLDELTLPTPPRGWKKFLQKG
jgi:hypothetical protein